MSSLKESAQGTRNVSMMNEAMQSITQGAGNNVKSRTAQLEISRNQQKARNPQSSHHGFSLRRCDTSFL